MANLNWKLIGMVAAIVGILVVAYIIYSKSKKAVLEEQLKIEKVKNLPQIKQKILDDIKDWEKRKADWFADAPVVDNIVRKGASGLESTYPPPQGYTGKIKNMGLGKYWYDTQTIDNIRKWFDSKIAELKEDLRNLGK
jgi:hypothetical protein